jgi:type VI secretion system secreted protein VgrG
MRQPPPFRKKALFQTFAGARPPRVEWPGSGTIKALDEDARMLAREAVISLPIPQSAHLERFESVERLSEPFVIEVDVICEEVEVDFLTHLGESALITVAQEGMSQRTFSGLIFEAEFQEEVEAGYRYHLVLRPWLYALSRNLDSIIFQNKSTKEIIQEVFDNRSCHDVDFTKLQKTYSKREYCVQYRESDFAFVSRLMEQEGIYYFFDHRDGRHVMVLCDDRSSHDESVYEELEYLAAKQTVLGDRVWRWTETVTTGAEDKATFRDYDFTAPAQSLEGAHSLTAAAFEGDTTTPEDELRISDPEQAPTGAASPAHKAEVYDYPTGFVDNNLGQTQAETAMLAHQAERRSYRGAGDPASLACGQLLQLSKHPLPRLNQKYLVVGLTYRLDAQAYVSGGDGASDEQPTVVEIIATPADTPWRAPRITPWPVARGPETATVVGPGGETIYTDKYGRVKVKFHWDRATPSADSTCWIRVASSSGDSAFGHVVLPRIGQEVVVDFLNGDPDRPLIVGSVYNAAKMPPYGLPDDKTRSIWRSHTINGGTDDYNELSFEDKTGEEVMNVQAQKDRTTLIKNDDTSTTKGNMSETITGNVSTTISQGDHSHTVSAGKRTTTIQQNEALTVNQGDMSTQVSVGSSSTSIPAGNYTLETTAGQVSVTAGTSITLTVGANSIKIDQTGVTINGMMITAKAQVQLQASALMTQVSGSAMTQITGGIIMIG